MEAWKRDLWERYPPPPVLDARSTRMALQLAGLAGVEPNQVFAACHRSAESAEVYAAANMEHYGLPTLAMFPADGGMVSIVGLRSELGRFAAGRT